MNVLQQDQDGWATEKGNEGYMGLEKEAQSRMNVGQQDQDVRATQEGNEGYMGLEKKHNLTECATAIVLGIAKLTLM